MNVYLPAESVEEQPRNRFLDWRFLAALAVVILLAFLVWAGFRNYEIREAEAAQKDALIKQLADRSQQIETLESDIARLIERAREDRRRSAMERAALLRQQKRMIRLLQEFGIPHADAPSRDAATTAPPRSAPNHSGETNVSRPVRPAQAHPTGKQRSAHRRNPGHPPRRGL